MATILSFLPKEEFVNKFCYFRKALITYIPDIVSWKWVIKGALVRLSSLLIYREEFMYIFINL
jgi:hypothetical protein